MTSEERFWPKVEKLGDDECWPWLSGLDHHGYGRFYSHKEGDKHRVVGAHRFAYELLVGPIPPGLELDHLCRNPRCVNPAHLEPVTHRENQLRGASPMATQARQTHCKNGHPFNEENTYWHGNKRQCRHCHRDWGRTNYKPLATHPEYVYAWGNNSRRAELKGRKCVIEASGTMGTCLLRFPDTGERVTSSRRALRKVNP